MFETRHAGSQLRDLRARGRDADEGHQWRSPSAHRAEPQAGQGRELSDQPREQIALHQRAQRARSRHAAAPRAQAGLLQPLHGSLAERSGREHRQSRRPHALPYLDDGREERLSVHREGAHVSRADHRAHADHAELQSGSRNPLGAHSGRRKGNVSAYCDSRRRRDAEPGVAVSAVPLGTGEAARQSRQHAASAGGDQPELQARLRSV